MGILGGPAPFNDAEDYRKVQSYYLDLVDRLERRSPYESWTQEVKKQYNKVVNDHKKLLESHAELASQVETLREENRYLRARSVDDAKNELLSLGELQWTEHNYIIMNRALWADRQAQIQKNIQFCKHMLISGACVYLAALSTFFVAVYHIVK